MIGEKQIIEARKQGLRPSAIFFEVGFDLPDFASRFERPENALATKQYPEVWVTPQDLESPLDLRFCVGCRALVHGKDWSDGFLRFVERLVQVEPLQIVAITNEGGDMMVWENKNWVAYADSSS